MQTELHPQDAGADVQLALCAGALAHVAAAGAASAAAPGTAPALLWLVVDGRGRALHSRWPLSGCISRDQGLALQLWQRDGPTASWRCLRRLRRNAPSQAEQAMPLLVRAIADLVRQAAVDRSLGVQRHGFGTPLQPGDPAPPDRRWPQRLASAWQAMLDRQHARWSGETWSVGLVDAPASTWVRAGGRLPVRWITRPAWRGYSADPMGVPGDPHHLYCEYYDERAGQGYIDRLTLDSLGQVERRERQPLGGGKHASFPLMVQLLGQTWGLLESAATGDCVLHRLDAQGHWQPHATLLQGVAVADPALFTWEGRFWLACTDLARGTDDNLCLYHADQLEGPWLPHANNPVKTDVAGARMAGPLFHAQLDDGPALLRPAQDCLNGYGRAVVMHRILRCTPTDFAEQRVTRIGPEAVAVGASGLHTVCAWGDRTLIDVKHEFFNPLALWRKLRRRLTWAAGAPPAPADGGPVRVCVYIPHLRLGGGETSLLRLAEGFARDGLDTTLVVHTLATAELPLPPGVTVVTLDSGGTLASVRSLARLLRQRRPHWLLSGFPHTNVAAVAAVALAGVDCRCIVSEHAPLQLQIQQQGRWRYRVLPPLVRWAYRRADAVVAVSQGVRDDLRRLVGASLQPRVIGNPVLDECAMTSTAGAATPPHPWLLDTRLQVVLSVSRLSAEKDLPVLVRAFAQLRVHRPQARLLLVGDGPEQASLQALLHTAGLADVACLAGRVQQPMAWMQRAAVFALVSRYEGFGNVLVEAMASGTPVVSTDCPVGPRELLANGRWGELVPVGDAVALAGALERALQQRGAPDGARAHAQQFTIGKASAAYRALFESLPGARC